jgi:multifunctional beta-oxidation protein
VGYLTSDANTKTSGGLFEIMGGWAAQTRWQKSGGVGFPMNRTLTPEDVLAKWGIICNFGESALVC